MKNKTDTRTRILEKAKEIIEKDGLKGLKIQRLIEECSIGKNTFYKLFPTKKDLLLQLRYLGKNDLRISSLKEQIAEIAHESFAKYGFCNVDMDSIARSAKLNRVTLYRYFSGKDDLLEYCIRREFNKIKYLLSEHIKNFADPEVAIRQYFNFLQNFLQTAGSNLLISESWNQSNNNTSIQALANDLSGYFFTTFVNLLEEGKTKGIFKQDMDSSIFAAIILLFQNGFMFTVTFGLQLGQDKLIMNTVLDMVIKQINQITQFN